MLVAMLCVTGVQIMLITRGNTDYIEWYIGFMTAIAGGFNILKHNQNISLARIINGNGGKENE